MTPKSPRRSSERAPSTDLRRQGLASASPRRAPRARAEERPAPPAGPRAPQQERGQRRVDAILDATAALIAEEGVAGVTMHRVARRSRTTIGSMYHFFPDRETLLRAIAERHASEIRALMAQIERDAVHWSRLSTVEVVNRLLDPFLTYSEQHPDFRPLARLARTTAWCTGRNVELDRLVARLAEAVVASRSPRIAPAELAVRAVTMAAIIDGIADAVARTPGTSHHAPSEAALRKELRRALVAYLDSYEVSPARPRATRQSRPEE